VDRLSEGAIDICKKADRYLDQAVLFEPQRSHYREVVNTWRRACEEPAQQAAKVVDLMEVFNRHVYRASADRLQASITELALQVAPVLPQPLKPDPEPFRSQIESALHWRPLIREVFTRGERLVDTSLLASSLLRLASDYRYSGSARPVPGLKSWEELEQIIGDAALARGIRFECKPPPDPRPNPDLRPIPGTRAVWATIGREVALNIVRHRPAQDANDYSPVLVMRYQDLEGTGQLRPGRVILTGRGSFFWSLRNEIRNEITSTDQLMDRVGETKEKWKRLGKAEANSSGAGLFFIMRICELAAMYADVHLLDPDKKIPINPASSSELDLEEAKKLPLNLVIEWPRKRAKDEKSGGFQREG
jgi:hypothetical protein